MLRWPTEPFITFTDGTKVYYETTDLDNRTTISFGVKRHNRNKFRCCRRTVIVF